MIAPNDAETIAALRAENAMLAAAVQQAESTAHTAGAFSPFSWTYGAALLLPGAKTVCLARDVAQGIALVLELAYDSETDAESSDEPPYLGVGQRGDLVRFAAVAAKMLADNAAHECDRLNGIARMG